VEDDHPDAGGSDTWSYAPPTPAGPKEPQVPEKDEGFSDEKEPLFTDEELAEAEKALVLKGSLATKEHILDAAGHGVPGKETDWFGNPKERPPDIIPPSFKEWLSILGAPTWGPDMGQTAEEAWDVFGPGVRALWSAWLNHTPAGRLWQKLQTHGDDGSASDPAGLDRRPGDPIPSFEPKLHQTRVESAPVVHEEVVWEGFQPRYGAYTGSGWTGGGTNSFDVPSYDPIDKVSLFHDALYHAAKGATDAHRIGAWADTWATEQSAQVPDSILSPVGRKVKSWYPLGMLLATSARFAGVPGVGEIPEGADVVENVGELVARLPLGEEDRLELISRLPSSEQVPWAPPFISLLGCGDIHSNPGPEHENKNVAAFLSCATYPESPVSMLSPQLLTRIGMMAEADARYGFLPWDREDDVPFLYMADELHRMGETICKSMYSSWCVLPDGAVYHVEELDELWNGWSDDDCFASEDEDCEDSWERDLTEDGDVESDPGPGTEGGGSTDPISFDAFSTYVKWWRSLLFSPVVWGHEVSTSAELRTLKWDQIPIVTAVVSAAPGDFADVNPVRDVNVESYPSAVDAAQAFLGQFWIWTPTLGEGPPLVPTPSYASLTTLLSVGTEKGQYATSIRGQDMTGARDVPALWLKMASAIAGVFSNGGATTVTTVVVRLLAYLLRVYQGEPQGWLGVGNLFVGRNLGPAFVPRGWWDLSFDHVAMQPVVNAALVNIHGLQLLFQGQDATVAITAALYGRQTWNGDTAVVPVREGFGISWTAYWILAHMEFPYYTEDTNYQVCDQRGLISAVGADCLTAMDSIRIPGPRKRVLLVCMSGDLDAVDLGGGAAVILDAAPIDIGVALTAVAHYAFAGNVAGVMHILDMACDWFISPNEVLKACYILSNAFVVPMPPTTCANIIPTQGQAIYNAAIGVGTAFGPGEGYTGINVAAAWPGAAARSGFTLPCGSKPGLQAEIRAGVRCDARIPAYDSTVELMRAAYVLTVQDRGSLPSPFPGPCELCYRLSLMAWAITKLSDMLVQSAGISFPQWMGTVAAAADFALVSHNIQDVTVTQSRLFSTLVGDGVPIFNVIHDVGNCWPTVWADPCSVAHVVPFSRAPWPIALGAPGIYPPGARMSVPGRKWDNPTTDHVWWRFPHQVDEKGAVIQKAMLELSALTSAVGASERIGVVTEGSYIATSQLCSFHSIAGTATIYIGVTGGRGTLTCTTYPAPIDFLFPPKMIRRAERWLDFGFPDARVAEGACATVPWWIPSFAAESFVGQDSNIRVDSAQTMSHFV
jgi:hypothetical protein